MSLENDTRKFVSIGVDFGMTYSSMAYTGIQVSSYGTPIPKTDIATDKTGTRVEHQFIPSEVCVYLENGDVVWVVGADAKEKAIKFGKNAHLYRNYKLLIGGSFLDSEYEVDLNPKLKELLKNITPDKVAQKVVEFLYRLAFGSEEAELYGCEINSVSVSVPALWPEDKKRDMENLVRTALKLSPMIPLRIIEEPIAALYHQIKSEGHLLKGPKKHVMVIDYGGGTCDIAIVKIEKDADKLQADSKKVANVTGRGSIDRGGVKIDRRIVEEIHKHLKGRAPNEDSTWYLREAEKLKISYANQIRDIRSKNMQAGIMLEYSIDSGYSKSSALKVSMSVEDFRKVIHPELSQLQEPIMSALALANDIEERRGRNKLTLSDIRHVFLAGGTTLLPLVRDEVRKIFEESDNSIGISDLEPRKAIVYGAALHAFYFETGLGLGIGLTLQDDIWLKDIFGRGIPVAKKGTSLPYTYSHSVRTIKTNMTELEVALFRGGSRSMKKNNSIESRHFQLCKPAGLWTEFTFEVKIDEGGLMDFTLKRTGHRDDTFVIKRWVPFRADIEDMAERAS